MPCQALFCGPPCPDHSDGEPIPPLTPDEQAAMDVEVAIEEDSRRLRTDKEYRKEREDLYAKALRQSGYTGTEARRAARILVRDMAEGI